uniref:Uncharacterized protein n=2 Tax=Anguilla anguilla TaxID=7936 RepID=A0A0E9T4U5_ANGAN
MFVGDEMLFSDTTKTLWKISALLRAFKCVRNSGYF